MSREQIALELVKIKMINDIKTYKEEEVIETYKYFLKEIKSINV